MDYKNNDLINKYVDLVLEENEKYNLTGSKTKEDFLVKHIEDSLTPITHLDLENKRIMDLGTGCGLPGIPLSIYLKNSTFDLVEPLQKRCKFLTLCKETLKLENINVLNVRVEDLKKDDKYDVIFSRAVKELRIILELSIPYLKVGGSLVLFKGRKLEEEIQNSKKALEILNAGIFQNIDITLSNGETRQVLVIKKLKETKDCYPRRYSQISKNPL